MSYSQVIKTLSRDGEIYYTAVDDCLVVYNQHIMFIPLEDANHIPNIVKKSCKYTDKHHREIREQWNSTRDRAVFTGITFSDPNNRDGKEINVYLATRQDGTQYPLYIQRKYVDLLGKDAPVYGTGNSLSDAYVNGYSECAYICTVRISLATVQKIADKVQDVLIVHILENQREP